MFGEGGSDGVGVDGLCDADALLGDPAVWIFAVESAPRGCRVYPHYWIQWRDRPVGTEGERCSCIQQGFPCIARLDTLRANDRFSPPTVVNCVIRLHGSDDAKLCEARVVLRVKVLRVLDAGAAIGRAIIFFQATVGVEDGAVGAIADGVNRTLQPGL